MNVMDNWRTIMDPMPRLAAVAAALALGVAGCTQEQTEQAAHPGQVTEGTAPEAEKLDQDNSSAKPNADSDTGPTAPNAGLDDPTPGQSNLTRPPS